MIFVSADFLCQYDYVEVFGGSLNALDSLGKFCGSSVPQPVVSQGFMMIRFVTDESVTDSGWLARYGIAGKLLYIFYSTSFHSKQNLQF